MPLPVCVIAAGLPAFTRHTITSPDVLRQRLSVIRLTQIATSRNEFECGKAAIAMPIFYGGAASRPPSNSPSEIWAAN